MVAVAVAGVALGILAERRARFLRIAARYEDASRHVWLYPGFLIPRQAFYDWAMQRKYERAARFPWLPVEADPPEPAKMSAADPLRNGRMPALPAEESSPFEDAPQQPP